MFIVQGSVWTKDEHKLHSDSAVFIPGTVPFSSILTSKRDVSSVNDNLLCVKSFYIGGKKRNMWRKLIQSFLLREAILMCLSVVYRKSALTSLLAYSSITSHENFITF